MIARILSIVVLVSGLLVCIGWILHVDVIKHVLPGAVSMKFSTAINFVLSGIVVHNIRMRKKREIPTYVLISTPMAIYALLAWTMMLLGMGYFGQKPEIALSLPHDVDSIMTVADGMPSVMTLVAFTLIGLAGVIGVVHERNALELRLACGIAIGLIGAVALLGYVLPSPTLYYYWPRASTAMAIHTALLFTLLGIAICASPFHGYYRKGRYAAS